MCNVSSSLCCFDYLFLLPDSLITAGLLGGSALVGAVAVGGVVLLAAGVTKLLKK